MTGNGESVLNQDMEKAIAFGKMDKHTKAIGKMTNQKERAE